MKTFSKMEDWPPETCPGPSITPRPERVVVRLRVGIGDGRWGNSMTKV
jgi:hypothetical protein